MYYLNFWFSDERMPVAMLNMFLLMGCSLKKFEKHCVRALEAFN